MRNILKRMRIAFVVILIMGVPMNASSSDQATTDTRWVNPLFQPLDVDRNGPFLILPDGRLLTADPENILLSDDDGKTWSEVAPARHGQQTKEPASFYLLQTKTGVLVMVYLDMTPGNWKFLWDTAVGEPKEGCRLELWAVRSLDGGKTWVDKQRLLDGYNANFFGFIQTSKGRLVLVAEHLVTNPGRWVSCSLISDDDGQTWKRSNLIDIGGHGHHDGATEPTVAELSDGRLLMFIRTNLGRFWQAISDDGGRYWRTIQPSSIDASTSPGYLLRLQSGRLVLVWNRLDPEGGESPKSAPGPASETPTSWYREELSIAFSEDDGVNWTKPIIIARQKGGQLSYPFVLERRPGELWVIPGFAFDKPGWKEPSPLRLKAQEEDLLRKAKESGY